jgi:hypothetical protein
MLGELDSHGTLYQLCPTVATDASMQSRVGQGRISCGAAIAACH